MAPLESSIRELVVWASEKGTRLDPRVEIYHDEVTGYSFRAREEIPSDTPIAVSDPSITISYLNATESLGYSSHSPLFPRAFISGLGGSHCHIVGYFFLIQQYLMGSNSFWYPYIRTLPQPTSPEDLPTPVGWSKEDQCFLADTNAGKAVDQKLKILQSDYQRGLTLLAIRPDIHRYTWELYLWAAMIFGTRSFRPSLTTSAHVLSAYSNHHNHLALAYLQNDDFSILYPVVDIGNHNGKNHVKWLVNNVNQFHLVTTNAIKKGAQIYNYYGPKSNSELLVGYGFILEDPEQDIVYLSLRPPSESRALRRLQTCHSYRPMPVKEDEGWRFRVFKAPMPLSDGRPGYGHFEHGLLETISCIVSNDRERRFLVAHPDYCLERDYELNSFNMSRNLIAAYQVLYEKLQIDLEKMRVSGKNLVAENQKQMLALQYRNRLIETLEVAAIPLTSIFDGLLRHNTLCFHDMHSDSRPSGSSKVARLLGSVELLPLECAYDWLRENFPSIYSRLVSLVSVIEEEPIPPRWNVLAKDFGHIYWTVWLFIVLTFYMDDSTVIAAYPDLWKWMDMVNSSFLEKLDEDDYLGHVGIDKQEQETIDEIINTVVHYPELQKCHASSLDTASIRVLAATMAFEETIVLPLKSDPADGTGSNLQGQYIPNLRSGDEEAAQKAVEVEGSETRTHLVLCISKDGPVTTPYERWKRG